MGKKYLRAELARELGKQRTTIGNWVNTGKLIIDSKGFIDVEHPINKEFLGRWTKASKLFGYSEKAKQVKDHVQEYHEARARLEQAKALRTELAYRQEEGELVEAKQIQKAAFEQGRKIRDALLMIPNKLADKEVKKIVKEEINKILKDLIK